MLKHLLRFFGYCVFILIFAFGLRFFNSYFFAILLFFFLIFPLVSVLTTRYVMKKLTYRMEVPVEITKSGEFSVRILTYNPTIIPLPRHKITFQIEHLFYPTAIEQTHSAGIAVFSHTALTIPIQALYSGYLRVTLLRAQAQDFLAFFPFKRKLEHIHQEILVLPQEIPAEFTTACVGGTGMVELAENETKGNDATQFIDVRKYQPGDKLNTIHWKLSVKMDELMVKEFGSLSDNDTCVLLDLYAPIPLAEDYKKDHYRLMNEGFDSIFDILHTISLHLLREKRPFTVCFFCTGIRELTYIDITRKEDLKELYMRLFYEKRSEYPNMSYDYFLRVNEVYQNFIYIHSTAAPIAACEYLFGNEHSEAVIVRRD